MPRQRAARLSHSVAEVKLSYYAGCRERLLTRDYASLVRFLHENGYTAIEPLESELAAEHIFASPSEAAELRALLNGQGISVSCYSVCTDLYSTPDASRDFLCSQARIAAALGSPYLHHTIYPPFVPTPNMPTYESALRVVLDPLCDVIRYAADLGVTVLYEPQGFVFNGHALTSLVEQLHSVSGCEGVGVCFDFGNSAFVDCPPTELLPELLPHVRHVHVKDYKYLDEHLASGAPYRTASHRPMAEVPLGEGDVDCRRLLAVLRNYGYDGYYSTESIPTQSGMDCDSAGISAANYIRKFLDF